MDDAEKYFMLTIVTPSGTKQEYNIRHMRAPGTEGDFGVLHNHLPFITSLRIGEIELDTGNGKKKWATSGGFIEVLNNNVTILAETAEQAELIDKERARAAKQRAIERLKDDTLDVDYERSRLALLRSINRLKIASQSH